MAGPPRPAILPRPDGSPVPIAVDARGAMLRVLVYRTWPEPALAAELAVPPPDRPAPRERWTRPVRVTWDGREGGAPARAGTYVVVAEVRDDAGNIGRSAPVGRDDLPEAGYGQALPGHAGVTVRYAAVEPPAEAVVAGRSAAFGVDTRQRPYRWSLRRLGHGRPERAGRMPPRRRGRVVPVGGTRRVAIPARERSGVLLFGVASGLGSARVPVAVQGAGHHPVLVVLPVMTWQGRNHVDDDGDGAPNLLEHGDGARAQRVYAGLPATFARVTAPLLAWLDRTGRRYDLTTDVALARGEGRGLEGHRGVVLAGDTRWLPAAVQRALRRYVQAGGRVATVGTDNLRRLVRLTPGGVLVHPTPPATFDALGLRPGALLHGDLTLTNAKDDAGLFTGTSGQFADLTVAEPVAGVRAGRVESSAVTADGRTVIAAVRSGDGLVIHLGLPELPSRLGAAANDPQAVALLQSTWTLLSR
ncbi:MAG TPA: N,N-dimethylformamidase beta subunit family domain-containing protein [Solirubrobacteraceae bacterium]|nr:N,N-dimethylformamidase beta subunit family domain-containing protein [Solirubrobacteraceae bacterium]